MCTRYYIGRSEELTPYIDAAKRSPLVQQISNILGKSFKDFGEIRPTDMTTVIAPGRDGKQAAFPMVWGYHIEGIKHPVVNARVESAKDKRNFSLDWQKHRCIIPASYYFEWEHIRTANGKTKTGQKYAIHPTDADITWLAGLYRIEKSNDLYYPVFVVLTREPSVELARIHDRMPVILPVAAISDWINPNEEPEKIIQHSLTDMAMRKAE